MYCMKCGRELPKDSLQCPYCDKEPDIETTSATTDEEKNPTKWSKVKSTASLFGKKVSNTAKTVGNKTKDTATVIGKKTKDISKEAGHRIADSFNNSKAKIEQMRADKKAAEDNKSAQDKIKDQVKLDQALKDAIDAYNDEYTTLSNYGMELYIQRERAADLILNIEDLINSIANRPKSFDADIQEIETKREEFKGISDYAVEELDAAKKSATGAGAGVAAGAAVASLAPTAAMWIATTFGTASTGTAISALSGAAATKAALAWLGGGAIAAGGGGTAAGSAFLAMCGPVGWSIAGATLLTSVVLFAANKAKLSKQKKEETEAVLSNTTVLKETNAKVGLIYNETQELRDNLSEMYRKGMSLFNKDFSSMSDDDKLMLGALVNNTKSLAASLSKTV